MAAPAVSALMGAILIDAILMRTGWNWFDQSFIYPGVALALTMFTACGVVNSFNIIDGMNGLTSICSTLMLGAIAYIAVQLNDALICGFAVATMGASLGFTVMNYPRGLIILGDGGAYLLGLVAVELGIMILRNHQSVSPLAPLAIMMYPVTETVFTMYRRKVLQKRPVSSPDASHLHTLIYRRLMRWTVGSNARAALTLGNSMTSPILWMLTLLAVLPSMIWWNNTLVIAIFMLVFVIIYLRIYWQIVRFKTPWWIKLIGGR
jgi:UDP-N-acetylmuramyl pentapeptide phosphotransferase/UDP-N-acetylglucosamine-1-phosphate transferase